MKMSTVSRSMMRFRATMPFSCGKARIPSARDRAIRWVTVSLVPVASRTRSM